jgi:hypothetical protein
MALVSKTFSDLITFTRASSGTYVNSAGLITNSTVGNYLTQSNTFDNAAWAKSNSFIQSNLILQSQSFGTASWTKQTGTSVTGVLVVAPDGTLTGAQVDWTTTSTSQGILQAAIPVSGASNNTKSIYVRADVAGGTVELADPSSTIGTPAFTLSTSWQRITLTETQTGGTAGVWLRKTASSPAIIYIWGAQLVQGSSPGDYRATTTTALPILYPDYNGVVRARKLCENTVSAYHGIYAGITPSTYVHSFFAKAGERAFVQLAGGSNGNDYVNFNLATGVISQQGSGVTNPFITPLQNGWYRVGATLNTTAVAPIIVVAQSGTAGHLQAYAGDGTSGIYIADALLNDGTAVGPYYETTSTITYTPRFDYDPVTLQPKGLLIEEQRANLVTYSAQFDNAVWTKENATVAQNVISPEGAITAWTLTNDVTNAQHRVYFDLGGVSTNSGTRSIFVKSGTADFVGLSASGADGAVFNLATGAKVADYGSAVGSISAAGNGWFRISVVPSTAYRYLIVIIGETAAQAIPGTSYAGTNKTILIWGAQLEAGAFATSYIPTVASQVTRAIDVANLNTLSPWFNSAAGTVFGDSQIIGRPTGSTNPFFSVFGSVGNLVAYNNSVNDNSINIFDGTNSVSIGYTSAIGTPRKFATTYGSAGLGAAWDGAVGTTVPYNGSFSGATYATIAATGKWNGWIRRITFYPQRLTNAQLQSITT